MLQRSINQKRDPPMQFKPLSQGQMIDIHQRHQRLRAKFDAFVTELEWFHEPTCPVPGIAVTKAQDGQSCTVAFASVTLHLNFAMRMEPENNVPVGHVTCRVPASSLGAPPPIIGGFTFNGSGRTKFDASTDSDPIGIEEHAGSILTHFLAIALARPIE